MSPPTTEVGRPDDANTEAAQGLPDQGVDSSLLPTAINRALPSHILHILATGAPGRNPGARQVWGKVVSVAMSARRRGWTEMQYIDEVWSKKTRRGDDGRKTHGYWPLTNQLLVSAKGNELRAHREVERAWKTAGDNLLQEHSLKTPEDFIADVIESAYAWEDRLDEGVDNLSITQKRVMLYVTTSVSKRRNSKVTCPCREVGAAAGIPYRTANYTMRHLADKGFLNLHDKGTHSADPKNWKAAIYSLSDSFSLPHGGRT